MNRNARTALLAGGLVAAMASLSFAAVPFYDWFCRVTGFGGAVDQAGLDGIEAVDQTVTVRFEASLDRGMPWTFKPVEREMTVRLGESGLAFYEARNPTDRPVVGRATYNVVPNAAGGFFAKIDCFCFTEQVLGPGESVRMPVSFFVDPAMLDDPEGRFVREITLGYTFYEIEGEDAQAALAAAAPTPLTPAAPASIE